MRANIGQPDFPSLCTPPSQHAHTQSPKPWRPQTSSHFPQSSSFVNALLPMSTCFGQWTLSLGDFEELVEVVHKLRTHQFHLSPKQQAPHTGSSYLNEVSDTHVFQSLECYEPFRCSRTDPEEPGGTNILTLFSLLRNFSILIALENVPVQAAS